MSSQLRHGCAWIAVVGGLLLAGFSYRSLAEKQVTGQRPNVLTLKGSPYGRIIAFAMRGPADVFWHRGQTEDVSFNLDAAAHEKRLKLDPEGNPIGDPSAGLLGAIQEMKKEHEEEEAEEHAELQEKHVAPKEETKGTREALVAKIESLRKAYYSRFGERGDTRLHRAYIRAEAEKKLRLSYEMDPTNLVCYGSYFLFLSESQSRVVGAENEHEVIQARQKAAQQLSEQTVYYCLNYPNEATAMITAASAAHDYLQILLSRPDADLVQAEKFLGHLDFGLDRFTAIRNEMQDSGTWENYSIYRINEMESAFSILRMTRLADHEQVEKRKALKVSPP